MFDYFLPKEILSVPRYERVGMRFCSCGQYGSIARWKKLVSFANFFQRWFWSNLWWN